jgi:nucleoside 2-deoxyribosyltransferase
MRLYLAGPMRGYPDENKDAFSKGAALLRKHGHFVFNPAENKTQKGGGLRDAMAIDMMWICMSAEGIAILEGSRQSLGASAEMALAMAISIPVMNIDWWLNMPAMESMS